MSVVYYVIPIIYADLIYFFSIPHFVDLLWTAVCIKDASHNKENTNMQNTTNTTGIAVPPTEYSPGIVYIILLYVHYITPLVAVLMNWLCILVLRHGQKRRPTTPAVYFLIHVSYFDTIATIAPFYVTYARYLNLFYLI